ncbi:MULTISPECIES: 4'-phosphopantetheinyl transferase superfamily protein [unclassified Beijerinckia]|uniref:4'-phosphopantetheinyl transferase family protein n=1 Tax=unclassified Beijerinckia TaxID=2638183 RepID=UPI00089C50C6|nr:MULTISPECIES: 4'-phosphopantetheinyl transferase superfamily protein [unclassified Beijerinckia]MDH7797438.1 phosphopantetheinyl transferase [Beijerinckia sp. GAS462]SEC85564.1 Phosphopantetheinyl transferase [Beijerinckia sp. 28-YEA-48]
MPVEIEWFFVDEIDNLAPVAAGNAATARVLAVDLSDPRAAPLLRADLLPSDLHDENRPAAGDRRHFRARRAALRTFVALHLGVTAETIDIAYDAAGAPRVRNLRQIPYISVSARGSLALLAVSSKPIGVDFEPETTTEPIIDVLHPQERATLAGLDGAARDRFFLEIWTAKEAYLKALGDGLTRDPSKIAISFTTAGLTISEANTSVALAGGDIRRLDLNGAAIIASCIVRDD